MWRLHIYIYISIDWQDPEADLVSMMMMVMVMGACGERQQVAKTVSARRTNVCCSDGILNLQALRSTDAGWAGVLRTATCFCSLTHKQIV